MDKDDGGPAFPRSGYTDLNGNMDHGSWGMSLRDYFAGQALAGVAGYAVFDPQGASSVKAVANETDSSNSATIAEACYQLADAMLEARKK